MDAVSVATWNIRRGRAVAGGDINLAQVLAPHALDLVALQEVPDHGGLDLVRNLGATLGLDHARYWGVGASDGSGVAILSRWPLLKIRNHIAEAPASWVLPKRTNFTVHQKGALSVDVATPLGRIAFSSLHLLPFHIFGLRDDHSEAIRIWDQLASRLLVQGSSPVIAGDFNGPTSLRLAGLVESVRLASALGDQATRPDGRSHDDILVDRKFKVVAQAALRTPSDHHLCTATLVDGDAT